METKEGYIQTKIGWIPDDWNIVKLDEIAEFRNGKAHEKNISEQGDYIVVNSKFISTDGAVVKRSNQNLSPLLSGNIVMVMSDVPNGKAIAKCFLIEKNDTYTLNQRICSISAIKANTIFLFNVLNRNKYYLRFDNGVGQTNLKKSEVLGCPIPLPPLSEQEKIAEILTTVDEKISSIDKQIQHAQQLKKGLMEKLLTEGIRHTEFKDTNIGRIPKSWDVRKLKDLTTIERGKFQHRPRNDPKFYGGKYPFIQTGDVSKSIGKINHYSQTLNDDGLIKSKLFPKGTIIITIAANIGDTAIASFDVAFPDSLVGITTRSSINNVFLEYYLRTKKEYLNKLSTVNAQKNINLETLKPLLVPMPPLPEQKQIATILTTVDDKLTVLQSKKTSHETLKKGLLQQLLTGKRRVKK